MESVSPRVLIVLDGHEPAGWACQARRAVSMLHNPILRILAVLDSEHPPFTSLAPFVRRAYSGAITYWREQQEVCVQEAIDEIAPFVPGPIDVVRVRGIKGGAREAIAEQVTDWCADALVVATPARSIVSRMRTASLSEDLMREGACAVIVTPCRAQLIEGVNG